MYTKLVQYSKLVHTSLFLYVFEDVLSSLVHYEINEHLYNSGEQVILITFFYLKVPTAVCCLTRAFKSNLFTPAKM